MITDILNYWNINFEGKLVDQTILFDNEIGSGTIEGFQLTDKLQLFRNQYVLNKEVNGETMPFEDDNEHVNILFSDTCSILFKAKENIQLKEGALIGNDKNNISWHLPKKKSIRMLMFRVKKTYFEKIVQRTDSLSEVFPINESFLVFEEMNQVMKGTYYRILELQKSPFFKELIYSCGSYLFHLLFEEIATKAKVRKEGEVTLNVQGVFLARNIIHEHKGIGINADYLARECGISKSHLRFNFSKAFGVSIYQYILSIKLEEAKKLMMKGDKTLSMIAMDLEFSSSSHFTTAFKKAFNITPKDYLKQHK